MTSPAARSCLVAVALTLVACGGLPPPTPGDARVERPGASPSPGALASGAATAPDPDASSPGPSLERLEAAHTIPDDTTWSRLATRPESASMARTEVVKFLVDLADDRALWWVDTARWDIHYFFARDRLARPGLPIESHDAFNTREYRRDDRRFEMGSVVHYLDADAWTLELISGDTLSGPRIERLLAQLRAAHFAGERLVFHPTSPTHEASIAPLGGRLPTITTDALVAGVRYAPLTVGTAFGTLRFVRGPLDLASVRPDQILVLDTLPDEIPVVAGVVSEPLQAPLGHIAILCATRGTPNASLRGALSEPAIVALEGQLVALEVTTQDWAVRPATREEAEADWAVRRPATPLVPALDAREARLRQVCDVRLEDADSVGAKAAQLGEACSLRGSIRTPGGFTVPFHHALAHLAAHGLDAEITAMLADPALRDDPRARDARLAALREAIEAAPVDPALLAQLARRMRELAPDARWILRSSTNAEDLPGFTGAGLYRSIVVPAHPSDEALATALREVWSSVWLLGAFEEREWYRVDHARVAMAVLAQPFVDGAAVNGVAITANPFFEGRPGYFVNAQALGGSVTGAAGDEVPEQHLLYTYTDVVETELLSRSSRTGGAPLLSEADLLALYEVLARLHGHFVPRWEGRANAVDVEFLFAGEDRHVVVLQARPYNVIWGDGQRWE